MWELVGVKCCSQPNSMSRAGVVNIHLGRTNSAKGFYVESALNTKCIIEMLSIIVFIANERAFMTIQKAWTLTREFEMS